MKFLNEDLVAWFVGVLKQIIRKFKLVPILDHFKCFPKDFDC